MLDNTYHCFKCKCVKDEELDGFRIYIDVPDPILETSWILCPMCFEKVKYFINGNTDGKDKEG